jgi:hypothetical protein
MAPAGSYGRRCLFAHLLDSRAMSLHIQNEQLVMCSISQIEYKYFADLETPTMFDTRACALYTSIPYSLQDLHIQAVARTRMPEMHALHFWSVVVRHGWD